MLAAKTSPAALMATCGRSVLATLVEGIRIRAAPGGGAQPIRVVVPTFFVCASDLRVEKAFPRRASRQHHAAWCAFSDLFPAGAGGPVCFVDTGLAQIPESAPACLEERGADDEAVAVRVERDLA